MNHDTQFRINIASPPDRQRLVAEIFFDEVQWAEVHQDVEPFEVEFYSRPDDQPWRLTVAVAIAALQAASDALVKRG